ncbi:hypothetical protein LJK88_49605 [Paenibacillus sp. P26]|nr:hypothetical protein LJK88_49605 [Paenibacillus sp. P26]UUZ91500.1 hypothetical protein LJK87_38740 [Paenibacillus sp. P25]
MSFRWVRSLVISLLLCTGNALISGVQLFVHMYYGRPPVFIFIFSCTLLVFLGIAVVIGLDLIYRDEIKLTGIIVYAGEREIRIAKANGKEQTFKFRKPIIALEPGQAVEIALTKRARIVSRITLLD